ncbi:MAG: LysE family transporter [Saprospiraceae bacterium]|nr:LysE family transporter [Saprospiraceae bacterium]
MKSIFRVFYTGMSISFFGSMVIGTISVSAMQIAITEGTRPAINFSLGSIVAEVIYVRLLLVALTWLRKQERIFKIMEWVAVLIVVILAIGSFKAALGHHGAKNVLLSHTMHRFFLGFTMRSISPAAIPFWLGWSSVLYSKGVLQQKRGSYNGYLLGIGLGTFLAHCVFIFGGKLAVEKLDAGQDLINLVIGCVFAVTAVIQIYKILTKKDAVEVLHEQPDEDQENAQTTKT